MDRVDGSRVKKTRSTVIAGALVTALAGGAAVVSGGAAGAAPGTSSEVGAYGSQTVGLSAQQVAISLKKGVSSTAVFYTAPGAHVAFAVNIPGSDTSSTGTA